MLIQRGKIKIKFISIAAVLFCCFILLVKAADKSAVHPTEESVLLGNQKEIIGETAIVSIVEAEMSYVSRIDTGAKSISLHAVDVEIENKSVNAKDNIGKRITFTTENTKAEKKRITAKIIDVSTIRNSQGVEERYVVELTFLYKDREGRKKVNLRDRSAMKYKLLIGRDGLQKVLVDVSQSSGGEIQ
jgi:hypothetical protein